MDPSWALVPRGIRDLHGVGRLLLMRGVGGVDDVKEDTIRFEDASVLRALFGVNDAHLRVLERSLGVTIRPGGRGVRIAGDAIPVELAGEVLSGVHRGVRRGPTALRGDVEG